MNNSLSPQTTQGVSNLERNLMTEIFVDDFRIQDEIFMPRSWFDGTNCILWKTWCLTMSPSNRFRGLRLELSRIVAGGICTISMAADWQIISDIVAPIVANGR